ncbi:hypothetical protein [Paenarthrobacter sp. NPDC090522]|uniref:hypothetical protein n=1 Tax=Paenarthrobacter sp. NPDC090522 TaxID=3364383 RepID=UPI0037FB3C1D
MKAVIVRPGQDHELAQKVFESSEEKERHFAELYIRLHNYVAAIASLVDLGNAYVKAAGDSEFMAEQERRNKVVKDSNAGLVLRGLRNYMLHNNVPDLEITVARTLSPDQNRSTLHVDSEKLLLGWANWSSGAKKYLRSVTVVDLGELVDEYSQLAEDYYAWFWAQVEDPTGA